KYGFEVESGKVTSLSTITGLLLVGGIGLTTIGIISLIANQSNKATQASTTDTNNQETLTEISYENKGRFHRTNEAIKAMIT
ncbi:MAG: hypothetical protein P5700_27085, partial [Arthrospira platensis PCC 7345]|nr:hypothetical protein [Arthrospira platensis PCC 7345]